jgi:hypothetical protein
VSGPTPNGGRDLDHRRFLAALEHRVRAEVLIDPVLRERLVPPLRDLLPDGVARALGSEFGDPLVRWFPATAPVAGVRVADGVLIFEHEPGRPGDVLFIEHSRAECAEELPESWRATARRVGVLTPEGIDIDG